MKFASILLLVLGAAGCSATRSMDDVGPETGSDASIEARLEILDPSIVGEGRARHLDLGLHNTSADKVECLVTSDWFDAMGRAVPLVPRQWLHVEIDSGATNKLRFDPMPSTAQSFRLRFASTERR
jgi:hypothetical protein